MMLVLLTFSFFGSAGQMLSVHQDAQMLGRTAGIRVPAENWKTETPRKIFYGMMGRPAKM
jgi:hypothetical protein